VHWMMPWQMAFWLCGALLVIALGMHLSRRPLLVRYVGFPRELGTVLGLFGLWQVAGQLSVMKVDGALSRGTWIWNLERTLYLPSEHWLQGLFLPHKTAVQFLNLYYASMHFTCMIIFLVWLFLRHRDAYPRIRTTIALTTAMALAIQLIPVAPPRMIPEAHLVDTALLYDQSVYGPINAYSPDQLSAMPSVHVAWSIIVAWAVITRSTSRWRWLILLHPVITVFVVVGTGNHYWADAIVAAAIDAAAISAVTLLTRYFRRVRSPEPALEPEPSATAPSSGPRR
jgi:hypothetical protein